MATTLFWDKFEETSVTLITASTPETGTGWTEIYKTASAAVVNVKPTGQSNVANVAGASTSESSVGAAYAINPAPSSADVRLEFTRYMLNWSVSNSYGCGVFARHSESGGLHTFYALLMVPNLHSSDSLRLYKVVENVATLLDSYDHTFANGDEIAFNCNDDGKTVEVNGYEVLSSTDNAITGAGNAGIWWGMFTAAMGTYHMRAEVEFGEFFVSEPSAGVALTGSASGGASTAGTLTVSGAAPAPPGPWDQDMTLRVRCDWDRDGALTEAYDDISARVIEAEWSLGMYMPYQEIADEARLEMTLANTDHRFTPEYGAGPLYGKLAPGVPVLVELIDATGAPHIMWRGWIQQLQPSWTPGGDNQPLYARVVALGAKQHLQAAKVHLDLLTNIRTDQAILAIFETVAFPPNLTGDWRLGVAGASELGQTTVLVDAAGETQFDAGNVTLSYVGDNWDEADAYGAIYDLVRAERGRFFFDRNGEAVFWSRAHLQTAIETAQALDRYQGLEYVYGDDLYNAARVRVAPRTISATATEVLYDLDEPITLRAGTSRTLRASYRQADSDALIAGMDITPPNTGDGSLATTGSLSVSVTPGATSAEIVVTNTSATEDGSLDTLIIRGRRLTSYGYQDVVKTDSNSVTIYGQRELYIDARLLDKASEAEQIAQWELLLHKAPRGLVYAVQMRNRDAATRAAQVSRTIGDRITLDVPQHDHRADYHIIGEIHRVTSGGKYHETTWRLEPAAPYNGWILGEPGYSELGETTRLGF